MQIKYGFSAPDFTYHFRMKMALMYAGNSTRPHINRFSYLLPLREVIAMDNP